MKNHLIPNILYFGALHLLIYLDDITTACVHTIVTIQF
jgi:hypothetical protein